MEFTMLRDRFSPYAQNYFPRYHVTVLLGTSSRWGLSPIVLVPRRDPNPGASSYIHSPHGHTKVPYMECAGYERPNKEAGCLCATQKNRANVVALVETHAEGQMQRALRCPWIGWAYRSVHTTHSRGVSLLIAKTTHFELRDSTIDLMGRYIFLRAKLHGDMILLLAFYVPPPFQFTVLTEGFNFMAMHPAVPAIWLGDFNNILDTTLDRMVGSPPSQVPTHSTRFARLNNDFNLADTWRHRKHTVRAFSCFSASHDSMSRIDLILVSKSLLPRLTDVGFSPRSISDHCLYWARFSLPHTHTHQHNGDSIPFG